MKAQHLWHQYKQIKISKMKTYILIFEDKQGNELKRDETTALNIKEARKTRDKVLANSMINDIFKIKVKLK